MMLYLCAGIAVLLLWRVVAMARTVPVMDLVAYWGAARVLISGDNPYSSVQLLPVEAAAGWTGSGVLPMWNPPWSLVFFIPLALFAYPTAYLILLAFNLTVVLVSSAVTWRLFGGELRDRWVASLLAVTFIPALADVGFGQIVGILLLGIVLFLRFSDSRPLLAGAATVLLMPKPHLLYLFWVSFALWIISQRRWRALTGAALALMLATLVPSLLRPPIWREYVQFVRSGAVLGYPSPTLGTVLRGCLGGDRGWVQFVPSALATVWMLVHWVRKRCTWTWADELPLILVVSVATTPYGWVFDQMVLLPAVLAIAASLSRRRDRGLWQVIAVYGSLNFAIVISVAAGVSGVGYAWTTPAWLLTYLFARTHVTPEMVPQTATVAGSV